MTPAFFVSVGGVNVTANFASILIELVVEDNEGADSDSCTITLADRNGSVALPQTGQIMAVGMGYKETGVPLMGIFTVDEVTAKGWPREIIVKGRAVEMVKGFKEHRNLAYENKTVGQIVQEIAGRHGLGAKLGPGAEHMYQYRAQNNSDMDFLHNLGVEHDCVASAKGGSLIFGKKGAMIFGTITATAPGNMKSYHWRNQDRPKHDGTRGHHWDRKKSKYIRSKG